MLLALHQTVSLCCLSVGRTAERVGICYLPGNTRGAAGSLFLGGLETGHLPYVEAKWNANGSLGLLSCSVLIIQHQIKIRRAKSIRFDLLWFCTKQTYYQGGFWLLSLFCLIWASLVNILQTPVVSVEQKQTLKETDSKEKVWFWCTGFWIIFFLSPLYSFVQKWQKWFPTWNTIVYDNKSVEFTAAVPSKMTL